MPDVDLLSLDFDNAKVEVESNFILTVGEGTLTGMGDDSRCSLSTKVYFPCGPAGLLQTDIGRQAHEILLGHLEALVQELREMLKD